MTGHLAELAGYQQQRLDLADTTRALLHVVRGIGDEQRVSDVRKLLTRLASGRFQLAVVGQFSRGKSTLMNALLGDTFLPMGALPMTSVVTTVRYGSRARALVRSSDASLPVEVPVADLARFVARQSADRRRMRVASVEVELPAEFLRLGFEFVDTPGVGSADPSSTAATLSYLSKADALIFVTGFDSPLTDAEAAFLRRAASRAGRLFVVINKRDLVPDADAAQVVDFVSRWIRENLGSAESGVLGVSALDALRAALTADSSLLARSGIEPFRAAVMQFLTADRGTVFLRNVASEISDLLGRQLCDLQVASPPAGGESKSRIETAFMRRISELIDHQHHRQAELTQHSLTAVTELFTNRGTAWASELRASVAAAVSPAGRGDGRLGHADDGPGSALEVMRVAGTSASTAWLDQRNGEIRETILSRTAEDISAILDAARSPRALGLAIADPRRPNDLGSVAGWSADDLPALATPVIAWSLPTRLPGHRGRLTRLGAAHAEQQMLADIAAEETQRFIGQARDAYLEAASRWASQLGRQSELMLRAEAEQFLRYLRSEPDDGYLDVVTGLQVRIDAFLAALETHGLVQFGSVASAGEPTDRGRAAEPGQCVICDETETAVAEHLVRGQYILAISESDQTRHAQAGGFCPLHTWQYAQIASPVGISAGYAKLAAATADLLADIESRSGSVEELGRAVARVAHPGGCPACASRADAERRGVTRLASRAPPAAAPLLCLRHISLVLQAAPSGAAARQMVRMLAAELRRAAEDMRAYALKREALRRGLITDEEANAYGRALHLLAGKPALVQPWSEVSSR